MKTISCTRMELLARKAQLELARQGRDMLEQKRTALMKEFMKIADTIMEHSDALQQTAAIALQTLARAKATVGPEAVHSASLASRTDLPLQVRTVSVMGMKTPEIEQKRISRSIFGRGYSVVGTSTMIDEVASAFEEEVEAIIRLADSELRLTRLANEIQRTSRRLNALDHMFIPRIEAECKYIQTALDEFERSDHFRLRLVKRTLERKRKLTELGNREESDYEHQIGA